MSASRSSKSIMATPRRSASPGGLGRNREPARPGNHARRRHGAAAAGLAIRPDALDGSARLPRPRRRAHRRRRRSGLRPAGLKAAPVAARRFDAAWHAFAASTREIKHAAADYFAIAIVKGGWRAELARLVPPTDWTDFARRTLALDEGADVIAYHDAAAGQRRFVAFEEGAFAGALFAVARSWIVQRLGVEVGAAERLRLLLGRPGAEARDRGAIVCACFDVGCKEILETAADLGEAATVAGIGARLKAGSNCGSCRGEIAKLIAPVAAQRMRST
jgi:bacterioferritin-associated ferredoxin